MTTRRTMTTPRTVTTPPQQRNPSAIPVKNKNRNANTNKNKVITAVPVLQQNPNVFLVVLHKHPRNDRDSPHLHRRHPAIQIRHVRVCKTAATWIKLSSEDSFICWNAHTNANRVHTEQAINQNFSLLLMDHHLHTHHAIGNCLVLLPVWVTTASCSTLVRFFEPAEFQSPAPVLRQENGPVP